MPFNERQDHSCFPCYHLQYGSCKSNDRYSSSPLALSLSQIQSVHPSSKSGPTCLDFFNCTRPLAVNFASESRDSFLLTEQEAESLSTLRRLWELAMSSPDLYSYLQLQSSRSDSRRDSAASVPRQISSREIQQFTETLFTDIIPTVDPGLRFLLFRFTAQLGSKWTRRLSQSIERSIKDRV